MLSLSLPPWDAIHQSEEALYGRVVTLPRPNSDIGVTVFVILYENALRDFATYEFQRVIMACDIMDLVDANLSGHHHWISGITEEQCSAFIKFVRANIKRWENEVDWEETDACWRELLRELEKRYRLLRWQYFTKPMALNKI
jgi:hypothetical protein